MLHIIVKTNSKESKVVFENGVYYMYTKSPAKENKANDEVISLLSKYLDVPKGSVNIKRGKKSKNKWVEIV